VEPEYKMKGMKKDMIQITKNQRMILEKEHGLRFGRDIFGSFSKKRHYYLVERPQFLELLKKINH